MKTVCPSLFRALSRALAAVCLVAALASPCLAEKKNGAAPKKTALVRWFGHGFFTVSSSTGIRAALDPFERGALGYLLPERISADVVLISHESDRLGSHASEQIAGEPQVFRSTMAVGVNKGGGMIFKGSKSFMDARKGAMGGRNIIYSFQMDGVRFVSLGALGHTLNSDEVADVGAADVVIAPVGTPELLGPEQVLAVARSLKAKVLVPAAYATQYTGKLKLAPLSAFLAAVGGTPVRELGSDQFRVSPELLPQSLEIWVPSLAAAPTPKETP